MAGLAIVATPIVEVGDGQVSDRPATIEPAVLIAALSGLSS
jgi:hypothetical protein